jgi:hypothetical protein
VIAEKIGTVVGIVGRRVQGRERSEARMIDAA